MNGNFTLRAKEGTTVHSNEDGDKNSHRPLRVSSGKNNALFALRKFVKGIRNSTTESQAAPAPETAKGARRGNGRKTTAAVDADAVVIGNGVGAQPAVVTNGICEADLPPITTEQREEWSDSEFYQMFANSGSSSPHLVQEAWRKDQDDVGVAEGDALQAVNDGGRGDNDAVSDDVEGKSSVVGEDGEGDSWAQSFVIGELGGLDEFKDGMGKRGSEKEEKEKKDRMEDVPETVAEHRLMFADPDQFSFSDKVYESCVLAQADKDTEVGAGYLDCDGAADGAADDVGDGVYGREALLESPVTSDATEITIDDEENTQMTRDVTEIKEITKENVADNPVPTTSSTEGVNTICDAEEEEDERRSSLTDFVSQVFLNTIFFETGR